jgi:SH3-like domain-containing protein
MAKSLLAEADQVRKAPDARFVKADRVNLRSAPDTESDVLAVLRADLPVFAEGDEGDWVLVRTVRGDVGWVHGNLLRAR